MRFRDFIFLTGMTIAFGVGAALTCAVVRPEFKFAALAAYSACFLVIAGAAKTLMNIRH